MKKLLSALAVTGLMFAGVACDDAPEDPNRLDEDDGRFGPGDGVDEPGPLR